MSYHTKVHNLWMHIIFLNINKAHRSQPLIPDIKTNIGDLSIDNQVDTRSGNKIDVSAFFREHLIRLAPAG